MRISVVIPVYNVKDYLRDCIDSLLCAAEGFDVEIICVDDGSTDDSGRMLDDMAERDRRLVVVHQPNAGVAAARNRGISRATGDWLSFVDADDYVRESYFDTISSGVKAHPAADLVGFDMLPFHGNPVRWQDCDEAWIDVGIDSRIGNELIEGSVCTFAYRRDVLGDLRFPPYFLGEDLVYVARAFSRSSSCVVTRRPEYCYRCHAASATHGKPTPERLRETIAFFVDMFSALSSSGKEIGSEFQVARGGEWLESIPRVLLPLRHRAEWRGVWELWLDSMSAAQGMSGLSDRQRRRAGRVAKRRTTWSVMWNCLWPGWLRRKGLLK